MSDSSDSSPVTDSVVKVGSKEGYLDEKERAAAELYFAKLIKFSRTQPNGATNNSALGKSWPPSSQDGLIAYMRGWQKVRNLRYRSDLLCHWAGLLELEGKIRILGDPTKTTKASLKLTPVPGKVPKAVSSSLFSQSDPNNNNSDKGINSSEMEKGIGGEQDREWISENIKSKTKSDKKAKKRKRNDGSEPKKDAKKQKRNHASGNAKQNNTYIPKFHRDKERFYNISNDMINGIRECDQILNSFWLQSQEDAQTITAMAKKIAQLVERREEDQNLINELREENMKLRIKLFQNDRQDIQADEILNEQQQRGPLDHYLARAEARSSSPTHSSIDFSSSAVEEEKDEEIESSGTPY